MGELFAMSGGQHDTAQEYLPVFADKARDNMSGWGIGFFLGTARSTPSFPGSGKNLPRGG
jgi:predicted glutamine amidotransferase